MWTKVFLLASLERAAKSAAQAALLVLGADQMNVFAVSWAEVGGLAGGGAVLSLLTSIGSAPFGNGGPSLATETVEPEWRDV